MGASSSLVLGLFPRMTYPGGVAFASGIFALAFNLGGSAVSPLIGRFVGQDSWDLVFLFLAGSVLAGAVWTYVWYVRASTLDTAGRSFS